MQVKVWPILRAVLPFVLAVALLAGLALTINFSQILDELGNANLLWLPLILASNYASDWWRAVRWRHLLSPPNRPGAMLLFLAAQLGSAVNLVLPLRAGEAVRVQIVSRRAGLGVSAIVGSLFAEVLTDLVTFATYIAIGLVLLQDARFLWPIAVAAPILALGGLALAYFLAQRADAQPERIASQAEGRIRAWIRRELDNFAHGLQSFRSPLSLLQVVIDSQLLWGAEVVMFWACGESLGLDLSIGAYMLLVVGANVSGAFPFTQSGIGVFEVTITGLMVALGTDDTQAAAYSIFVHVLLTAPHLLTGPLSALALRLSPSDILGARRAEETTPV
jgi:uncharacterized protein (TIRG00374 family)